MYGRVPVVDEKGDEYVLNDAFKIGNVVGSIWPLDEERDVGRSTASAYARTAPGSGPISVWGKTTPSCMA